MKRRKSDDFKLFVLILKKKMGTMNSECVLAIELGTTSTVLACNTSTSDLEIVDIRNSLFLLSVFFFNSKRFSVGNEVEHDPTVTDLS